MALSIYRVPRRLYWTADRRRLVEHGDPEAAFLAFPAGYELNIEQARRLGILDAVDATGDAVAVEKMRAAPQNKLRGRSADKAAPAVEPHIVETREKA